MTYDDVARLIAWIALGIAAGAIVAIYARGHLTVTPAVEAVKA